MPGPGQEEGRNQCWRGRPCSPPCPDRPDCQEPLGTRRGAGRAGCQLCNRSSGVCQGCLEVMCPGLRQLPPPRPNQRPLQTGDRPTEEPQGQQISLGPAPLSHSCRSGMNWAQRAPLPTLALWAGRAWPTPSLPPAACPGPRAPPLTGCPPRRPPCASSSARTLSCSSPGL